MRSASHAQYPLILWSSHPWRQLGLYGLLGSGVGILVGLLAGLGDPRLYRPKELVGGIIVGFFVATGALLMEALVFSLLGLSGQGEKKTSPVGESGETTAFILGCHAVRVVSYFLGGAVGRLAGVWIGMHLLRLENWASDLRDPFRSVLFGGLAVVVGLTCRAFARLRARLKASSLQLSKKDQTEKDLRTARSIQQRLLPPPEAQGAGYRIAARSLPAKVVTGDFYDFFPLGDGALAVAVGDVSGKGMGASLIMSSVKAMLPLVAPGRSVAETLVELNRRLCQELGPREFVGLALARFEPATGRLELANAGLPDPYLARTLKRQDPPQPIEAPGPRLPLGMRSGVVYESTQTELAVGDRVLFLTDGVVEARAPSQHPLGYESLAGLATGHYSTPGAWLDHLLDTVRQATSQQIEDDWTVLALERKPLAETTVPGNA